MTTIELESRLKSLEQDVARLKALAFKSQPPVGAWRATIGMFDDDPEFADVVRLGREYRQEQNKDQGE